VGPDQLQLMDIELPETLAGVVEALRKEWSGKTVLSLNLSPGIEPLLTDPSYLEIIVRHCVEDCHSAIGDAEGKILIDGGALDAVAPLDVRWTVKPTDVGKYVHLRVRAIPVEGGQLSMLDCSHEAIVPFLRALHGGLNVQQEDEASLTLSVILPALQRRAVAYRNEGSDAHFIKPHKTILFVDDDELIREVVADIFGEVQWSVITVGSGREAVDIFRKSKNDIGLVLLDFSLQDMSGDKTLELLREIDPHVKVIVSSGYAEEDVMSHFSSTKVIGFIEKPYAYAELVEMVMRILREHS
jgi:two-component system, cell cycle sensor histidine kinase and response regulator CckA